MIHEPVDAELKSRLESLGRGVEAGLRHIHDLVQQRVDEIKSAAPYPVMVKSRPRDWACTVCGTGMISSRNGVFVHVCESLGVYYDG